MATKTETTQLQLIQEYLRIKEEYDTWPARMKNNPSEFSATLPTLTEVEIGEQIDDNSPDPKTDLFFYRIMKYINTLTSQMSEIKLMLDDEHLVLLKLSC